jgi:hypothetical protein
MANAKYATGAIDFAFFRINNLFSVFRRGIHVNLPIIPVRNSVKDQFLS